MLEFLLNNYMWIKAFHIISVISWMAGMLYLPRIYVYHAEAKKNSEISELFKTMERKLLRLIINPAMILTWFFGGLMLYLKPELLSNNFMHIKITALLLLGIFHGFLSNWRRSFFKDENIHSAKFYRFANEVPTILMIIIVIMIIVRPF